MAQAISQEELLGKAYDFRLIRRLWQFIRPYKRLFLISMLVLPLRCLADLRVAIFSHVQKLPMSYFDRNPVGRLVTRMTTDVDVLQEMFSSGVITLASDF